MRIFSGLHIGTFKRIFYEEFFMPWWCGLVVSSPPTTEETGAMGRDIESRQGVGWQVFNQNCI
jgi:hypothetical protein